MKTEYLVEDIDSALIKSLSYNSDCNILTVYFRSYYTDKLSYKEFTDSDWKKLLLSESQGKYYLNNIKDFFSLTQKPSKMATQKKAAAPVKKERPATTNQSSDEKRFFKLSIDVSKIKKDWIYAGEKGSYLHVTLHVLPDGETDGYGNLGMITQDVPQEVYQKELGQKEKSKGPILGNACEFARKGAEGAPGESTGKMIDDLTAGDLPF